MGEAPGGDPRRASATSHSIVPERARGGGEDEDGGEAEEGRRRPGEGRGVEPGAAGCSGAATAGSQQGRPQKHKQGGRVPSAARRGQTPGREVPSGAHVLEEAGNPRTGNPGTRRGPSSVAA